MKKKDVRIIEKEILGKENVGYAYVYPLDGGGREEYVFQMTPKHIANFIGAHQFDADKMILTDMADRLILETAGGFIMDCPNQELCRKIIPLLTPIQMGECEAEEIPMVSRAVFDEYGFMEDQKISTMGMSML